MGTFANQLGSIFSPVISGVGQPIAGANVAIAQPVSISSAVAQAGLATLTLASSPASLGFAVGGTIMVAGFSGTDTAFNVGDFDQGVGVVGGATILAITATAIIYAAPNAAGTASSSGTVLQMGNSTMPPAGLVPLWSDPLLSEPQANPFGTDGGGNWSAFVGVAGFYYVQFYNRAIVTTLRGAFVGSGVIPAGPIINSISPSSGLAGTSVTITGSFGGGGSGPLPGGGVQVLFNGLPATITSFSPTTIMAVAPTGVSSGNVNVSINGAISNGVFFTVTAGSPTISSLSPTSGVIGDTITINGSNFDSSGVVTFNGVTATPSNWTSTQITVAVPTGATTGSVIVTVAGVGSNPAAFTVTGTTPIPTITSLTPNAAMVGVSITIAGSNFGLTQGTSTVTFNGHPAIPTSWGAGSIITPVPTGATTGPVVVSVGGVASNGVTFTVTTAANPVITSLNPNTGPVGTSVTIVGTGFDSTGTVKFGTIAVTPVSWTSTQIVFVVPTGATTPGPVVVTVGGVASAGATFTVTSGVTLPVTMSIASITGGLTLPTPGTYAGQPGISLFLTAPWSPSVALAVGNTVAVSGTSFYDGQFLVAGISPGSGGPDNYGMSLVAAGNTQSTVLVNQGTLHLP